MATCAIPFESGDQVLNVFQVLTLLSFGEGQLFRERLAVHGVLHDSLRGIGRRKVAVPLTRRIERDVRATFALAETGVADQLWVVATLQERHEPFA
jgi:hypothetical protein